MKLDDYIVEIDIGPSTYQFIDLNFKEIKLNISNIKTKDKSIATLWLGGNCFGVLFRHHKSYNIKCAESRCIGLCYKYRQLLIDDIMSKDFKGA